MTGKFGVNISFATVWLFTPEMFPTALRAGVTGASSASTRVGGVVASYLTNLVNLVLLGNPKISRIKSNN